MAWFESKGVGRGVLRGVSVCLGVVAFALAGYGQTKTPAADLAGGRFATNCGNATAAPIFESGKMNTGLYGVTNTLVVSDPDIVLIGNQWWMIFATGPAANPKRAIEPFAAFLPPGASLATTTTYPLDPMGGTWWERRRMERELPLRFRRTLAPKDGTGLRPRRHPWRWVPMAR